MIEVKKILKYFIIIQMLATFYILLTSKIIDYRTEKQIVDIIYDSVKEWNDNEAVLLEKVNQREVELSAGVDEKLSARLSGQILLQIESRGEAWYVYPHDQKRYYLGRPADTAQLIRSFGVELANEELLDYLYFEKPIPSSLSGRFVWAKNKQNEIFYFNPQTKAAEPIKNVEEISLFLKASGIGITNANIRKIEVGGLSK